MKMNKIFRSSKKMKIPFIEQMEQSECGLCCLAMVLSYYRCEVTLSELRDFSGISRDGTNLQSIKKMAEHFGLEAIGQRVKPEYLNAIDLPAILHWEDNHFVVLEKVLHNKIHILDPALGRRIIQGNEIKESFTGICLSLKPTKKLKKRKAPGILPKYLNFLWSQPGLVGMILLWSLIIQLLAIATPIFVQFIVDQVIGLNQWEYMKLAAFAIFLLVLVQLIFSLLRARMIVTLQTRLDWQLMNRFFSRLLHLPYHFFQLRTSGDLILRANSNMLVREILSTRTVTMLLDGGLVLIFLLYMLLQSVHLTVYVLIFGVSQVLVHLFSHRWTQMLSQEEILRQTRASSYLAEILRGIHVIKSEGAEKLAYNHWVGLFKDQLNAARKRGYLGAYVESFLHTLRYAAPLVILWFASREVINQQMSLGEMFAFFTLSVSFLTPLTSLVTTANKMVIMGTYFRRILDVLEATPEQEETKVIHPPDLQGNIELRDVSFRYSSHGPLVVDRVSLNIHSGQFVAIVGATGSGKTTLASLLIGLYQPTAGKILFDGHDLSELNKSAVRRQMGIVTQQVHLFNRSIYQNIALHKPDLSMDQVIKAAKLAEIHNEILKFPQKYNTLLSEEGSNLSGGQRQRIILARALVHRPAILLLDEATSALDTVTEQRIHDNLDQISCTRIVITHRISTIVRADIVLVVDQGRIIDSGRHEELLQRNQHYIRL